jgi:Tfp pilus assembly protein PilX
MSRKLLRIFRLAVASLALAATTRCTTSEEKTLGRLQTLCDDGTRAVSTYNKTLDRWETTITASPQKTCTGQMNARTRQVEVRCQ